MMFLFIVVIIWPSLVRHCVTAIVDECSLLLALLDVSSTTSSFSSAVSCAGSCSESVDASAAALAACASFSAAVGAMVAAVPPVLAFALELFLVRLGMMNGSLWDGCGIFVYLHNMYPERGPSVNHIRILEMVEEKWA